MSILFYDHLVDKSPIHLIIETLDVPAEKKSEFKNKVDDILHNGLLEFILQKLHPHNHHAFLAHLEKAPYDPELIKFLQEKIDNQIEKDLTDQANKIISLIQKDLTHQES